MRLPVIKLGIKEITHLTKGLPIELRFAPGTTALSLIFSEQLLDSINQQAGAAIVDLVKRSKG